ncbi:hypothetical protein N7488_005072 [Penicillium malachiteum]|nr:hypothetical protein N7488_005072 [Penicillium malachiteum]
MSYTVQFERQRNLRPDGWFIQLEYADSSVISQMSTELTMLSIGASYIVAPGKPSSTRDRDTE